MTFRNTRYPVSLGLVSACALMLAACGTEAREPEAAPAPAPVAEPEAPPAVETAQSPETPQPPETPEPASMDSETMPDMTEMSPPEGEASESDDIHGDEHGGEHSDDHADGEDHGHDADHADGDSHDHDDHDHAGGAAHVHGEAEGAIILEGETLTVSLDSALASFGLPESVPGTPEQQAERQTVLNALTDAAAVLEINSEAGCTLVSSEQSVRSVGEVGNAVLDFTFTCSDPGALDEATFVLFEDYPTKEEIDLAILIEVSQSAATLTSDARTASISGN